MDRLGNIIEIVKHSHHMSGVLSLLIGLFLLRKESYLFSDEEVGDNIPMTLIDALNK